MPVSLPDDTPHSRFLMWAAHRVAWIWVALLVAFAVDQVAHTVVTGIVSLVTIMAGMAVNYPIHRHGLTLCPRCASATPLNGPEKAAQRARWLWCSHQVYARKMMWFYLIVFAAMCILDLTIHVDLVLYWVGGITIATYSLREIHQPLQPWCPYCHWGDGGSEEKTPAPVPPSGVARV